MINQTSQKVSTQMNTNKIILKKEKKEDLAANLLMIRFKRTHHKH